MITRSSFMAESYNGQQKHTSLKPLNRIALNKNVYLSHDRNGTNVFVKVNDCFCQIQKERIQGIPQKVWDNPLKYQAFFNDVWTRLITLNDGCLKLAVMPRLRGGMMQNEPVQVPQAQRLDRQVLEKLREAIIYAQRASEKHVIALVGPTGVGKSTIVNHWLEKTLVRRSREVREDDILPVRLEVVDGEEIAPIGHKLSISETLYAQTYLIPNSNQAIVDCGGFYDTRGVANEITAVTSVKLTLEAAKSVKLVICCDYAKVKADRATGFTEIINTALGTLLGNYAGAETLFLITKPKPDDDLDGRLPTCEDIVGHIRQIIREYEQEGFGEERIAIYRYIIRDNGRYIIVYNPLENGSRERARLLLNEMMPISPTRGAFNPAYSARAGVTLLEEVVAIAVVGKGLYSRYINNAQVAAAYAADIFGLEGRIARIRGNITALGNDDPEVIRQAEGRLRVENQEIVNQADLEKERLQVAIREKETIVVAIHERIALADRVGDEEESYWKDFIDQDGINIENKKTVITNSKKSGWFSSTSSTKTDTTSTYYKRPIVRDFNYRGPEIARIVRAPADGICWLGEERGTHHFSIHYETAEGDAAHAKVEIFVKKKHFPDKVQERAGLVENLGLEQQSILALTRLVNEQEKRKIVAQRALDSSGNKMERLEEYQRALNELQGQLQQLQANFQTLQTEKAVILQAINANRPDFTFLVDYLGLSQDVRLQQREIVQEFIRLNQTFLQEGLGQ